MDVIIENAQNESYDESSSQLKKRNQRLSDGVQPYYNTKSKLDSNDLISHTQSHKELTQNSKKT